ncbi:hypothetical protein F5Y03DRAFT_338622 [Xylaria venustula]|nr:hypothetical protein F5Y03DRAFT_338622 [Xylaria venustula]
MWPPPNAGGGGDGRGWGGGRGGHAAFGGQQRPPPDNFNVPLYNTGRGGHSGSHGGRGRGVPPVGPPPSVRAVVAAGGAGAGVVGAFGGAGYHPGVGYGGFPPGTGYGGFGGPDRTHPNRAGPAWPCPGPAGPGPAGAGTGIGASAGGGGEHLQTAGTEPIGIGQGILLRSMHDVDMDVTPRGIVCGMFDREDPTNDVAVRHPGYLAYSGDIDKISTVFDFFKVGGPAAQAAKAPVPPGAASQIPSRLAEE